MMSPFISLHIHAAVHPLADLLLHTLLDTLKTLPFLFAAFLLLEYIEHRAGDRLRRFLTRAGKGGPVIGSLLGCVPQCGFSVLSANLYAGGVITLGTLIAVFLSTSDEALLLLAAQPAAAKEIGKLLLAKLCIGIAAGYLVDLAVCRSRRSPVEQVHSLCDHAHCGCDAHEGILRPALLHTGKMFGFLLLFSLAIQAAVHILGEERLQSLLLTDSIFQPFLAALLGFIPNCAASVLLTQLYLEGALQFGAVVSGLCTGAGAGLLVLWRENRKPKENLKISVILYIAAVLPGVLLQVLGR